jgi:hypothetical protein
VIDSRHRGRGDAARSRPSETERTNGVQGAPEIPICATIALLLTASIVAIIAYDKGSASPHAHSRTTSTSTRKGWPAAARSVPISRFSPKRHATAYTPQRKLQSTSVRTERDARLPALPRRKPSAAHVLPSPPGGYYPLYEDHFPVESLSQLPEFDFNGLVKSFEDAIRLLG